ncbi:cellulase family glycosylhydrolase [Microbacterium sp. NPDC091313]
MLARWRTRAAALWGALALVAVTATAAPAAHAAPSGWLHTSGSTIVTESGQPYVIRAVSWFGMETSNCAPHGLWTIGLDAGMAQIAGFGFTTVRVPFSNECLAASSTTSIDANANPGLVGKTPLQVLDAVVASAKAHGLNVILDRHRPDSAAQSELWYTARFSEQRWIDDWRMLAARYKDDPTVIGVDLHNEPHGTACWGCGDASRDWRAAAMRAGDAVLAVNPRLLIIVEGVERQPDGSSTWWGGGLAGAGAAPVTLSVAHRLVYSPHDYPASVYAQDWFRAADYPANLPAVWERNWGYLQTQGIAPVLLGEFGTKLETASDRQWLSTLVSYLAQKKMSFAFWSFNPNSGDTGGLVADDWRTPQSAKLAALAPLLTPTPTPTVTATPKPTATATATPKPTATATATPKPTATATATPKPTATATATPKPTATATATPKPTSSPSTSPTPVPSASSGAVTATWMLQNAWGAGYVAELTITARSAAKGWTVTWESPGATKIVNAWGMDCSLRASTVTCTGAGWTVPLAAGQTVRVGVQMDATAAPTSPVLRVSGS